MLTSMPFDGTSSGRSDMALDEDGFPLAAFRKV